MEHKNIWDIILYCAIKSGFAPQEVSVWKCRGYVPPRHHNNLVKAAKASRKGLSHDDLEALK